VAVNSAGTTYSPNQNYPSCVGTPPAFPGSYTVPSVTTSPATNLAAKSAVLNGTFNAGGSMAYVYFQWDTDASFAAPFNITSFQLSTTSGGISSAINGLLPNRTYYFRVMATNFKGTAVGVTQTVTTSP
jgi:hypothetical protein